MCFSSSLQGLIREGFYSFITLSRLTQANITSPGSSPNLFSPGHQSPVTALVKALDLGGVYMFVTLIRSCLYSKAPTCIVTPSSQTSVHTAPKTTWIRRWRRYSSLRHDLPLTPSLPITSIFLFKRTHQHKRTRSSQSAGFSLMQGLTGERWRAVRYEDSSGCLPWSKLLCPNGAYFPPKLKKGI